MSQNLGKPIAEDPFVSLFTVQDAIDDHLVSGGFKIEFDPRSTKQYDLRI